MESLRSRLTAAACLPEDRDRAMLIGRIWLPAAGGPALVRVTASDVCDLSGVAATASGLFEQDDPVGAIRRAAALPRIGSLDGILANSAAGDADDRLPHFLAPCDLQAIKAAGVTFVASTLERVIEEQARGDPAKAEAVRRSLVALIGDNLASVRPGSAQALAVKDALVAAGAWSQYLEVGIGPDAEIFTKVAADVGGRPRRRDRHSSGVGVEQPGARDRAGGRTADGQDRRRDAGQRRQPARLRGAQRAAARQGQGQQCVVRDRAVHPAVRRALRPRRRAPLRARDCRSTARTASRCPARARWR